MTDRTRPPWLAWTREIQALSQTGLAFSKSRYDRDIFSRMLEIAAEMVGEHTQLEAREVLRTFRVQPGYATAKVEVRAAVVREGNVLFVREDADGRWALPGGWADVGVSPAAMAEREVREESGVRCRAMKLLGVFSEGGGFVPDEFFYAYKLLFLCQDLGGEPEPGDGTLEARFFPLSEVPGLSPGRTNRRHIEELRAHLADPLRPAHFE